MPVLSTTSGWTGHRSWVGVVAALLVAATCLTPAPAGGPADGGVADPSLATIADPPSPDLVLPPTPGSGFTREVLWERKVSFEGRLLLSASAVDLTGDGLDEILVHGWRRNEPSGVVALDGASGDLLWRAGFPQRSCVVASDLDGDGAAEVVVAWGEELSVLEGATGERLRGTALRGSIGDLVCATVFERSDGGSPGRFGAGVVYTAGKKRDDVLVVLSGDDLRELWSRDAVEGSGPFATGFTYPSARDVDGDGRDEVLVAENGNHLLCFTANGEVAWNVGLGRCERLNPAGVVSSAPVVADLLGDGIAELAVGCFAGAVVVLDARTGEELDRLQFGVESHEEHLSNSKIPKFIRDALRDTGEPVNCLTAVELDGSAGSELVLGCSDGFVYSFDVGPGGVMWKFKTRDNVYDPCLIVGDAASASAADSPVDAGATSDLLLWDVEGVYLLDGETGQARGGFEDVDGANGLVACSIAGTTSPSLVRVAPERGVLTAWTFAEPVSHE